MTLSISPLSQDDFEQVAAITLHDSQIPFAGTAQEFLAADNPTIPRFVVKQGEQVIGYFRLDLDFSIAHSFCTADDIGLRTFVIDQKHQGKGFGGQAMKALAPFVAVHFPEKENIYLTVNYRNPSAKTCYEKAGFKSQSEPYLGGPVGPQHIMFIKIHS